MSGETSASSDEPVVPGRTPPGTRIYAVGDIHGQFPLLKHLHEAILEDAVAARKQHLRKVIVYLGDYIDRGGRSRDVIEMLCRPVLPGFEAVFLRGNHEEMMLAGLYDDSAVAGWYHNGGNATAVSYDVMPPYERDKPLTADLIAQLRHAVPDHHVAFLRGTRLFHREGGYLFVHAGLRPGVALEQQVTSDLVWIREPFLNTHEPRPYVIVHGHTPTPAPEDRGHRIGIDTGAFATGRLTCLVLEGDDKRMLSVTGRPV